jgi:hypothetical protein
MRAPRNPLGAWQASQAHTPRAANRPRTGAPWPRVDARGHETIVVRIRRASDGGRDYDRRLRGTPTTR